MMVLDRVCICIEDLPSGESFAIGLTDTSKKVVADHYIAGCRYLYLYDVYKQGYDKQGVALDQEFEFGYYIQTINGYHVVEEKVFNIHFERIEEIRQKKINQILE